MQVIKEITYLIQKEWLLETRQKQSISGLILYILSTVFVCYLSFEKIEDVITWNALLWIIILFVTTNAASKSFQNETGDKQLYIYTLVNPQAIILSKIIYNSILILILSIISYAIYSLLIGNLVENQLLFFMTVALGSMGLSSLLTMNAAIVSKTDNNTALMAILSFPLILPLLITILKISKQISMGFGWEKCSSLFLILILLNLLIAVLSYLLFPYLWRD